MTPRWPPILGVTGFDFGTKPAISLVIPRKRAKRKDEWETPITGGETPCIHCEEVDLWPEGELPPVVGTGEGSHPWQHYCLRQFVYDRADDGTLSNKRVFRVTRDGLEFAYDETTNWYDFDESWVTDALDNLSEPPPGDCAGSTGLQMAVHLFVEFYRETGINPTPPPKHIPTGAEEDSLLNVKEICYSYGVDIDEYYGIS